MRQWHNDIASLSKINPCIYRDMPRNKTFRKRNQKKIQKGGAFNMGESNFPKIDSTTSTKYYAYVVKTRKMGGASSSSSGSSSIGGGAGSILVAVSTLPTEYEYTTTIVNEEQRQKICNNESDNSDEKTKIITDAGTSAADNLKQFVEDESKNELITFFELNGGTETTLNGLTITKENVKWNDFVVC